MKYMNHLRKLALLSSLALSFAAYGDGTLPLPIVLDGDLTNLTEAAGPRLQLSVQTLVEKPSDVNIAPCGPGETYYAAKGAVVFMDVSFTVNVICQIKGDTNFTVFAKNGNTLTTLQGTAVLDSTATVVKGFVGNMVQQGPGALVISPTAFRLSRP